MTKYVCEGCGVEATDTEVDGITRKYYCPECGDMVGDTLIHSGP